MTSIVNDGDFYSVDSRDSDDEFFDCLEMFSDSMDLENVLKSIQRQKPDFKYQIINELDLLSAFFEVPSGSFYIVMRSPAIVIWVDVVRNNLVYFDPKGKLASKHGIDLERLKNDMGFPQAKIVQLRHQMSHDANLDSEQSCVNFILSRLLGQEIELEEEIPKLEISMIDTVSVFKPFGGSEKTETISAKIQHYINCRTILSGAMKSWDPDRIRQGRLQAYTKIGGQEVNLKTASGTVHACFFDVGKFQEKLYGMGGQPVEVSLFAREPLVQMAQPIEILFSDCDQAVGVIIPYHSDNAKLYEDLSGLRVLCEKHGLEILDQNLKVIKERPRGLGSLLSRQGNPYQQNLILVKSYVKKKAGQQFQVICKESFDETLQMFSPQIKRSSAIRFGENFDSIQDLFEKLQLNKTNYCFVELDGALYLIDIAHEAFFYSASLLDPEDLSLEEKVLPHKDLANGGVVLLTMNQTSSFMQYPHEILTFLFQGASVMAYDNFQKGLSFGKNTEEGIYEAAESSYRYLTDIQGFKDQQILAKGQCAGGPPTSQLGANHPFTNIWIDQAPASYSQMIDSLYKTYAGKGLEKFKKGFLSSTHVQQQIVNSSIIPKLARGILPRFDIPSNLLKNRGAQLFTIGVPDRESRGGDKLVPVEQQQQILEAISQNTRARYIPLMGGEHITDWWKTLEARGIIKFLRNLQITRTSLL